LVFFYFSKGLGRIPPAPSNHCGCFLPKTIKQKKKKKYKKIGNKNQGRVLYV
jgi:hypothetical protein